MDDPILAPLALTGERTAPGHAQESYWLARHEAVYAWIADRLVTPGAVVVDAGLGEGYGGAVLRRAGAGLVAGLEYDETACRHAAAAYDGIAVVRANLAAMPLRAGAADLVVSLQVIEHLWSLPGFLADCRRALRPGGTIAVSTPNRPAFSPGLGRGERPTNPFHVEEFDSGQVWSLLADAGFADVRVLGLRHGPRIEAWERAHGSVVAAQVAALLGRPAPDGLEEFVATVTPADFAVDEDGPAGAEDLIGIAAVP